MTRYSPLWLQAGSYAAGQDRRLLSTLWPSGGFTGMVPSVASGMTINISAGSAVVPTANGTGCTLCVSDAVEQITLPAAPGAGTSRYDGIIVRPRGTDLDGGVNNDWIFDSIQGVAAASPGFPAIPAGTFLLGWFLIPGGGSTPSGGAITPTNPAALAINPAAYPRGVLGQLYLTANSSTVSGANATTVWGSTTIISDGTRRIRILGSGTLQSSGAVNDTANLEIVEGATILAQSLVDFRFAGGPGATPLSVITQFVPAAGQHTYGLRVKQISGTGVFGVASATQPAILLVEDIGT